jgi:hypothetical protein
MTNRVIMLALLALLIAVADYPPDGGPVRIGFAYGLPLLLALLIVAGQRWAFMACVMYATVGLALDIATIVQDRPASPFVLSAAANCLLIILAGRAFMHEAGTPRSTPPPNPPPPPAAGCA